MFFKYFLCFIIISSAFKSYSQLVEKIIGNGKIEGNYIGGYYNYNKDSYPLFESNRTKESADFYVRNVSELLTALKEATSGNIIYLDDAGSFNLANKHPVEIPTGVSLVSGRGRNKSLGALVFSNQFKTLPLFKVTGNSVIIEGLRVRGPDSNIVNQQEVDRIIQRKKEINPSDQIDVNSVRSYGLPNSRGIEIEGINVVVRNCEVYNWSHAGVYIAEGGSVLVSHSYIHHNQRFGLGYGVSVQGIAIIKGNIFDFNRHAIASSGAVGTSYIAEYNICLGSSSIQGHIFDMHGGVDRKDNTNIAGDSLRINNNIFFTSFAPTIKVRGRPQYESYIFDNLFIDISSRTKPATLLSRLFGTKTVMPLEELIVQSNMTGNLSASGNVVN